MTKEEFIKAQQREFSNPQYSEPLYDCEECGGGMCRDNWGICACIPPKYKYVCNKCGHVDFI